MRTRSSSTVLVVRRNYQVWGILAAHYHLMMVFTVTIVATALGNGIRFIMFYYAGADNSPT